MRSDTNRSKGADGLNSEHLIYGGPSLILWLKKIFNTIILLEEVPTCFKEGIVTPVYKGKGKDPLLTSSYRGITLSSIMAKTLEILILNRMSPVLDEIGFPDINQTAYQKGISCADAIFSTQEVLLNYIRQGESPFLCFYDIEKAFDSVEFPILLHHLFSIGINGKSWRLIKSWYQSPISCVKLNNNLSAPFSISRGVKQGSVLSPSLFLVIMNSFLQRMRNLNSGGSLHGTFTGSAVHADDVRSIAPSIQSIITQSSEINSFTNNVGLKLNTSKLEVIQLSQKPTEPQDITLVDVAITTKKSARCLGVEWQSNLSASKSISTNIAKARKAFFGLGSTKAFHGDLNPLSSSNIFETCVLPVLLYGCETWLLDSSCIQALEKFQCEIGRRILKLSKFHANDTIRNGLHWPTVATRILIRKLTFLSKLLSNCNDTMSSRIFISLAIDDVYNISIIQQCKMLEASLATDVVDQCLTTPDCAPKIVRDNKEPLLKRDYELLLISAMCHPSVNSAAQIAQSVSWRKIWDNALDYGVKGTRCVQSVLRELCRPTFGDKLCHLCNCQISERCFSTHLSECHPSLLCHKSVAEVITLVSTLNMKFIMSIGSKLRHAIT